MDWSDILLKFASSTKWRHDWQLTCVRLSACFISWATGL